MRIMAFSAVVFAMTLGLVLPLAAQCVPPPIPTNGTTPPPIPTTGHLQPIPLVSGGMCMLAGCTLPWGSTINHGQSATAFQASSVACGSSCTSQTRTCSNGVLSGSFTSQSCSVAACAQCTLPWGGTINHGQSVTAFQASSVACGSSCSSQIRSCNNGVLSGTFSAQTCTVQPCCTWQSYSCNCVTSTCWTPTEEPQPYPCSVCDTCYGCF